MKKLLIALLACAALPVHAEYSFEVENNTDWRIVALEASEDGKSWGKFDIGRGIASGDSTTLVWGEHTDDSGCEWYFRAQYSDGTWSEAAAFDFCEEDLVLSFD